MNETPMKLHMCGTPEEWRPRRCTLCLHEDARGGHGDGWCLGPLCGEPAAFHVLYSVSPFHEGYICCEHAPLLVRLEHVVFHPLGEWCGLPLTYWDREQNACSEAPECDCPQCEANRILAERHEPLRLELPS